MLVILVLEYETITSSSGPITEATIDQVRNAFELNAFGALRVSNAVIPSMSKRKEGLIVNIGSIAGQVCVLCACFSILSRRFDLNFRTTPWNTLYCAAKAALHSISEGLAMECKPFGVKVMLVAPGGVTSNIANNQAETLTLSPTTMYKDYEPKIIQRMKASQGRGSMDTNEFARKVVAQALRATPPPYMTLGYNSTLFYLLQWLPRQYVLERMYKALIG